MARIISAIIRDDGPSWGVWSPQCPGLIAGDDTEEELLRSLPETIAYYFEDDHTIGDFDIVVHVEREVGGVFVRVARDDQLAARQAVADRIAAALADPALGERLRNVPPNWAGEVIYICALPTDTRAWLDNQLKASRGAVNVVVPLSDTVLWTRAFDDQIPVTPANPAVPARPAMPREVTATFADVAQAPDRQRILVPA